MQGYYQKNYKTYHEKTFSIDPSSFNLKTPDGRTFYMWEDPKLRELFDFLGFKVCDFSSSVSKTGSGDIWMSYVLDKK